MLWSGQPAKQLCLCLVQCLEESQTSWPYWSMVRLLTLKMDLLLKISRERHGKILHKWALWLFQIPSTSLQRKIHHDWFVSMCIFFQKPILCNPTGCPTIKFNSDPIYLAAADAKLLQSCLTLCNPRDSSPPGSPVGVHVSIQIRVFSGYMPRSKSAGSYMVALFFNLTFCPQFLVNWKSSLGTWDFRVSIFDWDIPEGLCGQAVPCGSC